MSLVVDTWDAGIREGRRVITAWDTWAFLCKMSWSRLGQLRAANNAVTQLLLTRKLLTASVHTGRAREWAGARGPKWKWSMRWVVYTYTPRRSPFQTFTSPAHLFSALPLPPLQGGERAVVHWKGKPGMYTYKLPIWTLKFFTCFYLWIIIYNLQ